MKFRLILTAVLSAALFSCDGDDDKAFNIPLGSYQGGFFVLNEGNASSGSVTFSTYNYSLLKQDIFGAENQGEGLGGYTQSMFFDDERAYVISSGSNQISVVNRYTFRHIATIDTGLSNPRYGVVHNGKAYVTNNAGFMDLTDDYLAVIDLSDFTLDAPIALGAIAEKIFVQNGKLYVLNGSYGEGNSIKVINPDSGSVDATIALSQSPNSFAIDGQKLYVLTNSSFSSPGPSHLIRINLATDAVESDITFPASMVSAQNLNIRDGIAYFSIGSKIYDEPLTSNTVSESEAFTSAATTLYGFQIFGVGLYITDAKDYASDGELLIYSPQGSLLKTLQTGLIPNSVYFN